MFLSSHVRLLGSGDDSILIKNASHSVKLVDDSDWYDQEVTFDSGHGFTVGDGVCLRAKSAGRLDMRNHLINDWPYEKRGKRIVCCLTNLS